MVDIHSATAEIRRGKENNKKKQNKNIMSASATQGGHNKRYIFEPFAVNRLGVFGKSLFQFLGSSTSRTHQKLLLFYCSTFAGF